MSSTRCIQSDLSQSPAELSNKPTKADIDAAIALVATLVLPDNDGPNDQTNLFRAAIIAKLAKIFLLFKDNIPYQQATLNVASLGCGTPDDFFALTLFLKAVNPTCVLNYVGLEINADSNTKMRSEFQNYGNLKLITVDASDLVATKEQLVAANVPVTGFDFILLRQPEILSHTHASLYERMLNRTIPFLAYEQSSVFVSVYDFLESIAAQVFFNDERYSIPENHELRICKVAAIQNTLGNWLEAESFSYMVKCKGLSLNLQNEIIPNKLYHEMRNTIPASAATTIILKLINNMQFQPALLYASAACHMGYLTILLRYRHELGITITPSEEYTKGALDYVKESGASLQDKITVLDLFTQCNTEDRALLETIEAPRPGNR
jgi:hypothetical protein